MYDSVFFKCPSCGSEIEVQSHVGPEMLDKYPEDNVPIGIAEDIIGQERPIICEECKGEFKAETFERRFISLHLIDFK